MAPHCKSTLRMDRLRQLLRPGCLTKYNLLSRLYFGQITDLLLTAGSGHNISLAR